MQNKKRKKNYIKADWQPDCSGPVCLQQPFTEGKPESDSPPIDKKQEKKDIKTIHLTADFAYYI